MLYQTLRAPFPSQHIHKWIFHVTHTCLKTFHCQWYLKPCKNHKVSCGWCCSKATGEMGKVKGCWMGEWGETLFQTGAAQWDHKPSWQPQKGRTPHISPGGTVYKINPHNLHIPTSGPFFFFTLSSYTHILQTIINHAVLFLYWLLSIRKRANMPRPNPNQNLR